MALKDTIDRFLRVFRRAQGETAATATTASDGQGRPPTFGEALTRFRVERGRQPTINEAREMYRDDGRVKSIQQTLARDTVRGGFQVKISEAPEPERAQEVADDLIDRLKLFSRLDDWARLTVRDGDTFLEVGVDAQREIVEVTRKPPIGMHRASNRQDRFDDPTRAYWYSDHTWATAPPEDALWFADWQIVHARWDHDEGARYGSPLLSAVRAPYKRMTQGELDIAIRRKTRAGMKFVHQFPEGTTNTDIDAYMERNKSALNDPFAAAQDFFGTADVKAVQGDANLGQIADVVHHVRTFWAGSPVPMSLVAYGQDLNRDVLEQQQDQYDRALEGVTQWVEDQLVRPLLELQWLLQGIWPAGMQWEIVWASKKVVTPDGVQAAADAVGKLKLTGLLPPEQLLAVLAEMIPTIDIDACLQYITEQSADEIARIAAAAAARTGRTPPPAPEEEEQEGGEGTVTTERWRARAIAGTR
jgi:hypothetical protein